MSDVNIQTFSGKVNVSNNFTVGSGHLFVDTQNNKVGLNTTTPEANLHVTGNTYISTDISLGGTLTMGTVTVEALHSLDAVTSVGNTTPHTIEFQNTDTSLVASGNVEVAKELTVSGNVEVAKELTVSGNVEVGTANLFVDTVNSRVGVGTAAPDANLHVVGNTYVSSNLEVGTANLFVDTLTGRVGIGTSQPSSTLHVLSPDFRCATLERSGGGGSALYLKNSSGNEWVVAEGSNGIFALNQSTDTFGETFTILTNRNVGIGTSNPATKLHVNGTITYNTKQATHDKYGETNYTSTNSGQNLRYVTISADGIAHVHVTGLWRMTAFSGINGTGTEAAYFNIRKNSTEVTASSVGHRVTKLGNANDDQRWVPIVMSWSGAVSSGDTINVYANSVENNIHFNELDLNVLVV